MRQLLRNEFLGALRRDKNLGAFGHTAAAKEILLGAAVILHHAHLDELLLHGVLSKKSRAAEARLACFHAGELTRGSCRG